MLKNNSIAGTIESNDIMIELYKDNKGRSIELESSVKKQFGDEIIAIINETLDEYNINDVKVIANDKGALNFTIKARVKTAILRGLE